jgi:hypothetical protein
MSTIYTFVLLCTMKKKKKTEKNRLKIRGGKKNNYLFSFELGFFKNILPDVFNVKRKKEKMLRWEY